MPEIFVGALRLSWQRRRALFDIALIPLIVSLAIDVFVKPVLIDANYTVALQSNPGGVFIGLLGYILLSLLPWSAFAVGWTRHCLLGPPPVGPSPAGPSPAGPLTAQWTSRELRYFGATLKLLLVYGVGSFIAMLIVLTVHGGQMPTSTSLVLISLGLLVAMGYVLTRLCLVLPAAALDQPFGFVTALRYSQGKGLSLLMLMLLLFLLAFFSGPLAAIVIGQVLAQFFDQPFSIGPDLVLRLAVEIASYACSAPLLAAMGLAFSRLTGWQQGGALRPLP